jgi:DNA-binding NtrC family response regulator
LLATMSERGRIRLFRSSLRGELGMESDVEISGAPLAGERWILVVRPVGRRLQDSATPSASLATRVSELSGMLGKAGLKELVGTIADLVERHLILAALEATGGNRTAAAELLMLSRQTLYTKLRDHEIADGSGE